MKFSTKSLLLFVLAICLVLGAYSYYLNVVTPRQEQFDCMYKMRQTAFGILNYESAHKRFPQTVTLGSDGRPWHSWRIEVLPFQEQIHVDDYDFGQPWDHKNNQGYLNRPPRRFQCESDHKNPTNLLHVNFVVVMGDETMFPPSSAVRWEDIKDGASNTILLVESLNSGIKFTEPKDLDFATMSFKINDLSKPSISSHHSGGVNVVFADGSASFMTDKIKPAELRALLTIDGGEKITRQDLIERGILGG